MKKKLLFSLISFLMAELLVYSSTAQAQAPNWRTAIPFGTSSITGSYNSSTVTGMATDTNGNVYMTGTFNGTIQVGGTTLTSTGSNDIFITKWNNTNQSFAWAMSAGGLSDEAMPRLVLSGGSIYLSGYYRSPFFRIGTTNLTNVGGNSGSADIYVVKLVDTGSLASVVWAQNVGGSGHESSESLAVAGSNVYVGGGFTTSNLVIGSSVLTPTANTDAFVVKITDAGSTASLVWGQRLGDPGDDYATALAVAGSNVYVVGDFKGTATFSGGTLTAPSPGYNNLYVARLTDAGSTGMFAWARPAGAAGDLYSRCIGVNGNAVYIAGEFGGGAAILGTTMLTTAYTGNTEICVARLTDTGTTANWNWAQQGGGASSKNVGAILVQGASVYLAGYFGGSSATFGSTTLLNNSFSGSKLFVTRLLDAGTGSFVWAQQAGGALFYDYIQAMAQSGTTLYVGGSVNLPTTFGTQTLSGVAGTTSSFFASLTDPALPTRATAALPGVTLFPNPARGMATVRVPASTGAASLILLDALGRVVRTAKVSAGQDYPLDLVGLTPGVYALRLQTEGATATSSLVVE